MKRLIADPFDQMKGLVRNAIGSESSIIHIRCTVQESGVKYVFMGPYGCIMAGKDLTSREGSLPEPPPMPTENDWPEGILWLSPNEQKLWKVISEDAWISAEDISQATGIPYDKELHILLRNVVDRKFLESKSGKGYRRLPRKKA